MRSRLGIVLCLSITALALTPPATQAAGWEYDLALYLWALGMDGSTKVRGNDADIDVSFSDIFDNLDGAFAAHLEANQHEGNWGWFFDVFWSSLGNDLKEPMGEFELDMAYIEGAGAYNLNPSFQLFAGIRYITMDMELTRDPQIPLPQIIPRMEIEGSESFADLMLGGRFEKELGERWQFWGRADFAGFGLTDGTDLTWNLILMGRVMVSKRIGLLAGYRWFDLDYENTDKDFALDVLQHGPIVALSYSF